MTADSLTSDLMEKKRAEVMECCKLYIAALPSTLHKYRFVELQTRLDALFEEDPEGDSEGEGEGEGES